VAVALEWAVGAVAPFANDQVRQRGGCEAPGRSHWAQSSFRCGRKFSITQTSCPTRKELNVIRRPSG